MSYRIGIDIGGTFTDLYLQDDDGSGDSFKVPTTHGNLTAGVLEGLRKASNKRDRTISELLADTDRLIHGTTIATNAILEDKVAETALICTSGFKDTLLFREGGKEDPYEWDLDYPDPFVPRSLTFGVTERITAEGDVITPLDEADARTIIEQIVNQNVDAVAVSLLWSYVNPEHEERIGKLIEEIAPELDYSLSHQVNPIIREYRRTSSTAIDASLHGPINEYLSNLSNKLVAAGYSQEPLLITANGGIMQFDEVADRPIWAVDSGPTMLPVAAMEFVNSELGRNNVIALDMGGTSIDMGVVKDGSIPRTREAEVGDSILGIEKVEVVSIGAGGGSLAWVDDGGLLHVGPQSAGSQPGPACYDRGGERPTVTDAALTLGYVNDDYFLGGTMDIDRTAAETAIDEYIGEPLGLDTIDAATSIYGTANQNIINGIENVTIARGIDPRNYVLSGGGGALGMHAVPVAREFQIENLLLPRDAGVVSSIGGIVSDIRRDFSTSYFTESSSFDRAGVNDILESLVSSARSFFDRVDVPEERRDMSLYTEARYPQQVWEIEVELPGTRLDKKDKNEIVDRFHRVHEETYGFNIEKQDVEFLYWRVEANGRTDQELATTAIDPSANLKSARNDNRNAYFDGTMQSTPAYRGDLLAPGHSFDGPAIIDAKNTTIVVPPETTFAVTDMGNYHITTYD